ncbi:MAG: gamma-glutamyl-gamma-aminobutyrate hydrolase family protein [Magnetococcales bacterium]|nr:gamma-glutamyl-gamma-aminobutyrate hydrolase family protein [Magnetococcales bacterium]MBF0156994.1 gamma-glutamyl-gamma-aminobutyrate hydrolase family protein [Magnetococcales bacterium]
MRIGYLRAGVTSGALREGFGDFLTMFADYFRRHLPHWQLVAYDVREGVLPGSPQECDGWLCGGSASSVFDAEPWIEPLKVFAREVSAADRPILGICFGHQLLAEALGGKVVRAPVGWGLGVRSVAITARQSWMVPPEERINLLHSHQDQVVRLPPGALHLGGNDHCPNAMFLHRDCVLGMQGHPEFSRDFLSALMQTRQGIIDPSLIREAEKSLLLETHEGIVGEWIGRFFEARG